jgi:hypothetical protein
MLSIAGLRLSGFPSAVTAGTSATFTVAAVDANGKTVPGYRGTVHFTSSDGQAAVPANYTFTAADNGVHTFSVTLKTAGTRALTATDMTTTSVAGSQAALTVTPAAAGSLRVTGFAASTTAGVGGSFTVTAIDPYGNTATAYRGTVHFRSNDSQAVLPGNYTFAATDNGTHTFGATPKTAGTFSLTAADTASIISGIQGAITVTPAAASSLRVTGFASPDLAGTASSFTVTAVDPYGNVASSYRGTVRFSTGDTRAVLPGNYTFTAADNGRHSFSATLKTVGTWSLTGQDTTTGAIAGSQTAISVFTTAGTPPAGGGGSQTGGGTIHLPSGLPITNPVSPQPAPPPVKSPARAPRPILIAPALQQLIEPGVAFWLD